MGFAREMNGGVDIKVPRPASLYRANEVRSAKLHYTAFWYLCLICISNKDKVAPACGDLGHAASSFVQKLERRDVPNYHIKESTWKKESQHITSIDYQTCTCAFDKVRGQEKYKKKPQVS